MGILYSSSSEALAAIRASGRLPHHSRVDGNNDRNWKTEVLNQPLDTKNSFATRDHKGKNKVDIRNQNDQGVQKLVFKKQIPRNVAINEFDLRG